MFEKLKQLGKDSAMSGIKKSIAESTDPLQPTDREEWIEETVVAISNAWICKYNKGTDEHKKDLGELPIASLLYEMENEALDQLSFVRELKRRLEIE